MGCITGKHAVDGDEMTRDTRSKNNNTNNNNINNINNSNNNNNNVIHNENNKEVKTQDLTHNEENGKSNHSEMEEHDIEREDEIGGEEEEEENDEDDIEIYEGIDEHYQFLEQIGSGGYSVVKEAVEIETGEHFAIKAVKMDAFEDADAGQDPLLPLKREIRIMQKVNHPNIIKLYKVYIDEDTFYMVLELMPQCEDLYDRVVRYKGYPEKEASHVFRQLAMAVEYLHSLGVAHRDLKPENVLVCGTGEDERLKLADFGFAKHFKEEQMKTALGSPAYAAPELFTDDTYTEAVDVWSLGVILYLLLSAKPPFYGDTVMEITEKIIKCDFDFNDPIFDDEVSEGAKDLICHLLIKDPAKRFTAKQVLLTKWVQGIIEN